MKRTSIGITYLAFISLLAVLCMIAITALIIWTGETIATPWLYYFTFFSYLAAAAAGTIVQGLGGLFRKSRTGLDPADARTKLLREWSLWRTDLHSASDDDVISFYYWAKKHRPQLLDLPVDPLRLPEIRELLLPFITRAPKP